ncbi:MAG: DUF262 domain-containing protein [Elusimicrobiota bacterium]|jgi:uncharacterized protein with ParB-like and HNH nuclease domain|nr:DUF262 domain-containing protein [Elusimicrobiota bacterium]
MNVEKITVNDFLGQENSQFIVPIYQRKYDWDKDRCEKMWNNILQLHLKNKSSYFLGTMICTIQKNTDLNFSTTAIMDGYQRLITIMLLLIALRDYLLKNPTETLSAQQIENKYLVNTGFSDSKHYKLFLMQGQRQEMENIINGNPSDKESLFVKNYDFFKEQIEKGTAKIAPQQIYDSLQKLEIALITLEYGKDDFYEIFESVGNLTAKLDALDAIKMDIFIGLNAEAQQRVYEKFWLKLEQTVLPKKDQPEHLKNFINNYLCLRTDRDGYEKEGILFKRYHQESGLTSEELCKDIEKNLNFYEIMRKYKTDDEELNARYQELSKGRMFWNPYFVALMLKLLEDCYDKKLITSKDICEIIDICMSASLRYCLGYDHDRFYDAPYYLLSGVIGNIDPKDYINSIKASILSGDRSNRILKDDKFHAAFAKQRVIFPNRSVLYIFMRLERYCDGPSIKLDEAWVNFIGSGSRIGHEISGNIGNLALIADGAEDEKFWKLAFNEQLRSTGSNKLTINQGIGERYWDAWAVIKRAQWLADKALKVWAYPTIDRESKYYEEVMSKKNKE